MTDLDELERQARRSKSMMEAYERAARSGAVDWVPVEVDPDDLLALVERVRSKERESAVEEWLPWARDRYGSQTCDQERADRAEAELEALRERVGDYADAVEENRPALAWELRNLLEPVKP